MAAYNYKALAPDGSISKGIIEGESERQVRSLLRQRQLKPIEVAVARSGLQLFHRSNPQTRQTVDAAELALFTRQIATLLLAGVTLDEALAATARQNTTPAVKSLVLQIRGKVVAGHGLAASLAEFPEAFSELYCAMVRAGEHAGMLGEVLDQLAGHLERRHHLQQKVRMALAYPLVLLCVALGVIALLMVMVIPELVNLFARTGAELPLLTRGLIAVSGFVASAWWLLLLLAIGLPAVSTHLLRERRWRERRDRLLLRLPLVGRLLIAADTARFAATLSILAQSGVALVDALDIAAGVMSNLVLRQRTRRVAGAVQEGGSLAHALDSCGFFPPMLTQMVASGESGSALDGMLARGSAMQERELELTLEGLMKVMEPLIVVVMAVVVGGIVVAVLLPIMQMNALVT